LSESDEMLYGIAIGKAWEKFLKRVENGEFIYHNEQEMRCFFFAECLRYLGQYFGPPYAIFVDYKVDNRQIDLAIPINEHIFAIEIKLNPHPYGAEHDLIRLRELVDKNIAVRGAFMTLALSDYGLKERLREREIFKKIGLKEEGESDFGYVMWHTFQRSLDSKALDALCVFLWRR